MRLFVHLLMYLFAFGINEPKTSRNWQEMFVYKINKKQVYPCENRFKSGGFESKSMSMHLNYALFCSREIIGPAPLSVS